ncbi:hypothetical protein B7463_g3278, partial [Scytalidium lignicola]
MKHRDPDRERDTDHELAPFISSPKPGDELDSNDSNQSSSPRDISPCPSRSECQAEDTHSETLYDVYLTHNSSLHHRFNEPTTWSQRWSNNFERHFVIRLVDISYEIILRVFPILGFVAICSGIVSMAGIFRGEHVLNGLAHFIKGGVFFWFGILTLGRWAGCPSRQGWAWNLQPLRREHNPLSMETIECSLIFLYGITNVFLEHLTAWGQAWSPMDLEHVGVSLLFIGGGLCGLMVESKALRGTEAHDMHLNNDGVSKPTHVRSRIRINPIPAMIIFLLGLIISGHHQTSKESTMMHNQVGNFLAGASGARCITYLFLHISPPISVSPSRPPSELVCSFCLMCGGVILMASNKDTVQAMIDNHIPAMFVATVTMGTTAIIMAWVIFAITLKGSAASSYTDKFLLGPKLHIAPSDGDGTGATVARVGAALVVKATTGGIIIGVRLYAIYVDGVRLVVGIMYRVDGHSSANRCHTASNGFTALYVVDISGALNTHDEVWSGGAIEGLLERDAVASQGGDLELASELVYAGRVVVGIPALST